MSDPPATSSVVVELRVHGVSGTGADQVLDRPNVRQVAGDRSGGFYRRRLTVHGGARDGHSASGSPC